MMEQNAKTTLLQSLAALLLLSALLLTLLIYRQGLGGSLHFDDGINLGWLAEVNQGNPALAYVMNGRSGLLGRPLALATFVPQAYAWPDLTGIFILTNIQLHLINGLLIAWLAFLLGRTLGRDNGQSAILAALTATTWMLLPILASSSLLIVQRMNLLSATLVLAGLVAYLYFRQKINERPSLAITAMSTSIGLASILAILAKENGALLPLYILALELSLLNRPNRIKAATWKTWYLLFLVVPALVILGYLLARYPYAQKIIYSRNFNGSERLLTEAHILWQYLLHTLLPSPTAFGPFQDGQVVHRNWLAASSLFAWCGWVVVIALAFKFKQKAPLFTLATAWYLLGHSLESTTIPLELYFEHRNYLPIFGPVFALLAYVTSHAMPGRRIAYTLLTLFIGLQASILYSVTSLWGNPPLAAEMWNRYEPNSIRAAQYLAQQLQADDYHIAARKVLMAYLERHPDAEAVRIQVLHISCGIQQTDANRQMLEKLENGLPTYYFQRGAFDALARLYENTLHKPCEGVNSDTIYRLAEILAANPAYQAYTLEQHNLHILMARIGIEKRDLDLTMRHLEQALASNHNMPTLLLAVNILTSAGLNSTAREFADEAATYRPDNPIKAAIWDYQFRQLQAALDKLETS